MFLACHTRLIALGCGGLSGFIFTLAIPKAEIGIFAWFCFLPALLAYRWTSDAALTGLAFGIVSGVGRIYWITETLQLFGGLEPLGAMVTNALLIAYMSLYSCLFFYLIRRILPPLDPRSPWVAASLWVFLEWLQDWVITGFPWELVGYSQYRFSCLAQVASLTGVYGVSFLILLVNVALAQFAANRYAWRRLIAPALLIGLALTYGQYRLDLLAKESDRSLSVGVIQGNFPQDIKWDKNRLTETATRYAFLSRSLAESKPDLVVYPETALPFRFRHPRYGDLRAKIEATATELETPLLVGSLDGVKSGNSEALYNRAFLLDTDGQIVDFSDKVHLVPFGEYIPFPSVFQYLEGLTTESGAFTHGVKRKAMHLPGTTERFGVFICYEAIFPGIARELVRGGSTFLVNITNDAWFGSSAAPYQHLAMAAFRAIETGRSVVRVANTGITCLITPSGSISQATELFTTTAFVLGVETRTETTTYTLIGDLFVFGCGLYLALEFCYRWIRKQTQLPGRS